MELDRHTAATSLHWLQDHQVNFLCFKVSNCTPPSVHLNCGFQKSNHITQFTLQGKLVPKLKLGLFLTLSVRNVQILQKYLFQEYIYIYTLLVGPHMTKKLVNPQHFYYCFNEEKMPKKLAKIKSFNKRMARSALIAWFL